MPRMRTRYIYTLSTEACDAIRAQALHEFHSTAEARDDGMWDVPFSEEVADRLEALRFDGESDSDLMLRIIATHAGQVS